MTAHELYKHPRYYDIAFGWEPGPETDFLQSVFRRTAPGEVRSVLDVACGSGRFALEFARRGLAVAGLDISPEMLDYLGKKAASVELPVEVFVRDMRDFRLPRQGFDAAICMADSFAYLLDIPAITGHLHSVAHHLRDRGIYVVDFGTVVDPNHPFGVPERWEMTRDEVRVNFTGNQWEDYDPVRQTATEVLRMEVSEHGQAYVIEQRAAKRVIHPQEFLALVAASGVFELAEWFQGFDLNKPFTIPPYHRRVIAVLRKIAKPPPATPRPRSEVNEPAQPSWGQARATKARRPEQKGRASRDAGRRNPRKRSRAEVPAAPPEPRREDHPPSDQERPRAVPASPVRLPAGRGDDEPIVEYWARGREDKWQPPRAPRPAADEPPDTGDHPPAAVTRTRGSRRRKRADGGPPPKGDAGGQGG